MSHEFTPAEAMEFFRKMWNPLGIPMPGMPPVTEASAAARGTAQPGAPAGQGGSVPAMQMPFIPFPGMPAQMASAMNLFATFDPAEVEKKINDFKSIEGWLSMQLSMLQMTIKTMEMQKASLDALHAQAKANPQTPSGSDLK
jgi:hypothetical protein